MTDFFADILQAFKSFVEWTFSTPSGFGVSIGGLLVGINVLAVIVYYVLDRYK